MINYLEKIILKYKLEFYVVKKSAKNHSKELKLKNIKKIKNLQIKLMINKNMIKCKKGARKNIANLILKILT